ncbi:MAG: hypothetical protein ACRCSF_10635 [Mycobacteriaceae bacterium]
MSLSRTELQQWRPWTLADLAGPLTEAATVVSELMNNTVSSIDTMDITGQWRGEAQKTAYAQAEEAKSFAQKIAFALEDLAQVFSHTANDIAYPREHVLNLALEAQEQGFTVSDQWVVGIAPGNYSSEELLAKEPLRLSYQQRIAEVVADIVRADQQGTEKTLDILRGLPEPARTDASTSGVTIPGPPPDPGTDAGSAGHGSQPWYSRLDDLAYEQVVQKAIQAAEAKGLTHAAKNLQHYLDNSGEDLTLEVDEMLRDVPIVQKTTNDLTAAEVNRITQEAIAHGNYNQPIAFQTGWEDYIIDQDQYPDWFLATGSGHQAVSGVVTVQPPNTPGAQPTVSVDYQTHVFDRYNWDGSKKNRDLGCHHYR